MCTVLMPFLFHKWAVPQVDPTIPLFGFIGRLEEQKGVDILLAALPQLANLGLSGAQPKYDDDTTYLHAPHLSPAAKPSS